MDRKFSSRDHKQINAFTVFLFRFNFFEMYTTHAAIICFRLESIFVFYCDLLIVCDFTI